MANGKLSPEDEYRRLKGYGPDVRVPVSLKSPTFPPDEARNLEMQRDRKPMRVARRIGLAPMRSGKPTARSIQAAAPISSPSRAKPSAWDGKFACAGGNLGLAAGGCYGDGEPYVYSGFAWPPGVDITTGHAPGGVKGYLKGWSVSGNGLPGAGVSFTDGQPSANAWTVGKPGVSATYGMSLRDIVGRFEDAAADASKGIYNMIGRPYDDRRDR